MSFVLSANKDQHHGELGALRSGSIWVAARLIKFGVVLAPLVFQAQPMDAVASFEAVTKPTRRRSSAAKDTEKLRCLT